MKKMTSLLLLATVIVLNGCSAQNDKTTNSDTGAANNFVELTVKDGQYVIEEGSKPSEGEGYLALDINLENKTKDTLNLFAEDFSLYDSDGNKVSSKNIYAEDEDGLSTFSGATLSGSKTANGHIIFTVEKGKSYELHYKPSYYDGETEPKEIELKVDTKKYIDDTESIQQAAKQYVETVFLGNENINNTNSSSESSSESTEKQKDSSINLQNDLEAEHQEFNKAFTNIVMSDLFDYYEPSTVEAQKIVEAYELANQKNGSITYTVGKLFPNTAVVYIKPELIDFYDIDVDSIDEEFIDKNENNYDSFDYDQIYMDAEKYRVQRLPEIFEKTEVTSSIDGDGYALTLKKSTEDGEWVVDSSDSYDNYSYSSMKEDFMGGLYE